LIKATHGTAPVDRYMGERGVHVGNISKKVKMYDVVCKCPFYNCGTLHVEQYEHVPIVMPRRACPRHRHNLQDEDLLGAHQKRYVPSKKYIREEDGGG